MGTHTPGCEYPLLRTSATRRGGVALAWVGWANGAEGADATTNRDEASRMVRVGHLTHFESDPYRWRALRNIVRPMRRTSQQRVRWTLGALGLGAALLATSPAVDAADGGAYVLSDVQCDTNHNGVLDLTLVNERASQEAVFEVTEPASGNNSAIAVAAASVSAITFTDLADGAFTVPVVVDGIDAAVAVKVSCDAPEVAVMAAPPRAQSAAEPSLPATGQSSTGGLVIGGALVAAGVAVSLVARRRYF